MILSLFSGCGGLDLGFERAGFLTGLAFDIRPHSITSWNANRSEPRRGYVADVSELTLPDLDRAYGSRFAPSGVIGGPPCQSFTRANHFRSTEDPRRNLISTFFKLSLRLHRWRGPLKFIVMENVTELASEDEGRLLERECLRLDRAGFLVQLLFLDAADHGVPQSRRRLFLVAINREELAGRLPNEPEKSATKATVRDAIYDLPEPVYYSRGIIASELPVHPNHWCMTPKSARFFDGSLKAGDCSSRSFKTLAWDRPSIAVSYGHREVHVHPSGTRRLSVYEAMKLQGFPDSFILMGTLSAQIDQVSEAVPPPLAEAVARWVRSAIKGEADQIGQGQVHLNSSRPASAAAE